MTIRGFFFIGLFGICSLWALAEPFAGVVAYIVHYHSYPERSWWGSGLTDAGFRYSFTITACLSVGTLLNLGRLRYGRLVTRQEALYMAFLALMCLLGWLNGMKSASFNGRSTGNVDAVEKMIKMAVFVLAMTHVVVTPRRFEQLALLLVCCAAYLGYEAFSAPASMYRQGRLDGVGGPDFGDSNAMAAHMLALLPIIGVRFLRGSWTGKLLSFVAGGLGVNAIVATRSRAAFLAAMIGFVLALILAPREGRRKFWPLLLLGGIGSLLLVDKGFLERMGTLKTEERQGDESAMSRLRLWEGGMNIIQDYPLGVGPSNFSAYIGIYLPQDVGWDAHQTYIRCAAELGIPGFVVFVLLIFGAGHTLVGIRSSLAAVPGAEDLTWMAYALQISLIMYLICGLFGSFIYSEMLWWLLLLPTALQRATANLDGFALGAIDVQSQSGQPAV